MQTKQEKGKPQSPTSEKKRAAISIPSQSSGSPNSLLTLQRQLGNQALQRLSESGMLQAKLRIGQPGDRHEQEAERVAVQIGHTVPPAVQRQENEEPLQAKPSIGPITPLVQRQVEEEREDEEEAQEEMLQASLIAAPPTGVVQRQEDDEEEEEEQEEGVVQARTKAGEIDFSSEQAGQVSQSLHSGGVPLSPSIRAFYEPRFERNFDQVRVHTGSQAADTARRINARAFTVGEHIVFGAGEYAPETRAGRHLLSHELTHAVQQGKAQPGSKSMVQRQEMIEGFSAEEVEEFGEGVEELGLGEDTGKAARTSVGEGGGTAVHKAGRIAREQYLRKMPDPAKGDNVSATLHFNDLVFVEAVGGDKDGWYRIVSATGRTGWVPAESVALDPPEPEAELYRVKSGDTAIDLAARWYKPEGGFERWWVPGSSGEGDARFFVAALAFANKGRGGMPSPDDLTERSAWKKVKVIEGFNIWKPTRSFMLSLQGRVSSGSISREIWEDVKSAAKKVWGWIVYAAAFIAGLLYGAGESIYDLFAGIVELVKMVWDVGKSLLTGNIIQDAKELWENIKKLDLSAMATDFLNKWNADDPWDRGFFRGRVLGYVIIEVLMLIFSGGILSALKWTGKFAKIGALIAKIPKIEKIAELGKAMKIPGKAKDFLKARYAGKLGAAGVKILKGVEKGKVAIEAYLKTAEHINKRVAAFQKYLARGGKKSRAAYDKIYDTLTRNRLVGKLAEDQFQLVMKGSPKSYYVTVGGKKVLRKVDNVLGNVAREVKSGPLKLTPFIEKQILKDMQLIKVRGLKVEWHLLAGGEPTALAALRKAGIDVIIY